MNYQYPMTQSPIEALDQKSKSSSEYDKNGQHNAGCLFVNRISEPWPRKYIKYVLMEWYIYRNEKDHPPGPWNCPLPSCNAYFETFRDVITHLEDCRCLKPNTRHYTCPDCHQIAQVPAAVESPGQKAMLKLTRSIESIRDQFSPRSQPSSPGSSPTAASFSSNLSLTQAKELASPTSHCAEKPTCNPQELGSSVKQNMMGSIKIDTQLRPPPMYELYCGLSGLTPATTSSYRSELPTPFSAHGLSSAFPQTIVTPSDSTGFELPGSNGPNGFSYASPTHTPCDAQQFSGFHHHSTCADFQDHTMFQEGQPLLNEENFFSEDTANMQQDGANMQGILPSFPFESNPDVDYPDMLQRFEHQLDDSFQWRNQRGSIFTGLHMGISQERIPGPQVINLTTDFDADTAPDLTSPASCADMSMAETLVASEGNPSPTSPMSTTPIDGKSSSSSLSCPECNWSPDTTERNRSPSKLQLAVAKHFKRNHQGQNHPCPACPQSFRNRPDNVKPHVKRKHPEVFKKIYGQKKKTVAAARAHDQSWSPAGEGRACSNMEAPVGKTAVKKRNGKYARSPRGFARPEDQL